MQDINENFENKWIEARNPLELAQLQTYPLQPEILPTEEAVGEMMLAELEETARQKSGPINIALLGGRGGQAFHRLLGERLRQGKINPLLARLNVFTQDALAPMAMGNSLSFVRDFERLLGPAFFEQVRSFVPMRTDSPNPFAALNQFVNLLEAAGDLDIFFLGHGPEPQGASHLAYIKPGSGAGVNSLAGLIPISTTILEHHISKFKAGGMLVSTEDETEARAATHIMTLGPAALLKAKKLVQAVVDAHTAPAKKRSYRKVMETNLSSDLAIRAIQIDANPGLWIRLHPNVRSFVLPNYIV